MTLGPNTALIGEPDGLDRLQTPALVVDLDAMDRNIAAMAAFAAGAGRQLRPHAKTHKSADVAARQLAAGAVGICCAKLSEAEALAAEGIGPLLITSPIVEAGALARLAALRRRSGGLAVVVDSAPGLTAVAKALAGQETTVFVDLDPGQHRTGAPSAPAAVTLAQCIRRSPHLHFGGLQFFSGPSQHIEDFAERASDVRRRTGYLAAVVDALRTAGLSPPLVTGGGTGTHRLDAELGLITELQVGSYVFMDDQYVACQLGADGGRDFETALFVATRVISANHAGLATLDAGYKATTGSPLPPSVAAGAAQGARYEYRGDEHGALILPDGAPPPELGGMVMLRTPHCDPTVNLYDVFHVVRGRELVDVWPITARGCSW